MLIKNGSYSCNKLQAYDRNEGTEIHIIVDHSVSVYPDQFFLPYNLILHIIRSVRKYINSTIESIENPVNNPIKPPKLAKNAVGPYSSFRSEVMNCPDLKNIVKLDK